MASNPFFSGRIPSELYQQIEKHCEEVGDSKTEVLIKALSAYLNFPIIIPGKNVVAATPEITKEMFEKLEQRVKLLEESFEIRTNIVIGNDNNDNKTNKVELETNKNDVIKTDIIDNKDLHIKINELDYLKNKSEFQAEVEKKTNLTRRQISTLLEKAIEKIKEQGKIIKPGQLLEEPIEVIRKDEILVNDVPYKLFYLGENIKERPVWNLIPSDNRCYQDVIRKDSYLDFKTDNSNYQLDNNNTKEETVNCPVQESVEKSADEQT
jgi:hypothetical protein